MSEESVSRMRAESRVVEVEKQCSMLEFDLKQSVQKMEQLMKQKERLEDEVRQHHPRPATHPADTDTEQASNDHCVIQKTKIVSFTALF